MERKIGEIFEYNGEWYQCIGNPYNECTDCDFCFEIGRACVRQIVGQCSMSNRSDGLSVVFKKLETVGEPYVSYCKLRQRYKLSIPLTLTNGILDEDISCDEAENIIDIAIKQDQEDMEEKKYELEKLLAAFVNNKITYAEYEKSVEEWYKNKYSKEEYKEENLTLKPFDLEAARSGKPVCTRDGRKSRIICFDVKAKKPIAALITNDDTEEVHFYYDDGRSDQYLEYRYDLMMLPEKKEGWVNVYKGGLLDTKSYNTKKEAFDKASPKDYIDTVKIEWYE